MRHGAYWRIAAAAAFVAALANVGACTKDNIVYRDKASTAYGDPPAAAKGFIGYTDSTAPGYSPGAVCFVSSGDLTLRPRGRRHRDNHPRHGNHRI